MRVYVVDLPRVTVRLDGVAEIEKSPVSTVRVTVFECDTCWPAPVVPVMTSEYVPAGVEPEVLTLSVVDPEAVTAVGANVPVAPAGSPLTLNVTTPVKPVPAVTVAVYKVPAPADTVCEDGVADSVKSGTVIVRETMGLARPRLSVAWNDATNVPGVEYCTLPGFATDAEAGLPPGNVHEYALIVPSESVASPEKEID